MMFLNKNNVFIIAELSANHNGSLEIAIETIKAAKKCGADAIKLQTYTADTITLNSQKEDFIIKGGTLWDNRTMYDLYKEAYTPWEWHDKLFEAARSLDLICFSSPFDFSSVDFLEKYDVPAYKIASFEITDIPLIKYAASKKKTMIISTGIADHNDIQLAIDTCKSVGNNDIILLKCTSSYPAPIESANLKTMVDFKNKFNVNYGLSDHTKGITVPIVATSLGASVIEKHFILDKSLGGPDVEFSLDKKEFREMVRHVREAEKSLGKITYEISEKQKTNKQFSRSLYFCDNIKKGEIITKNHIRSVRPGYGLHTKYYDQVIGQAVTRNFEKGDRVIFEAFKKKLNK